MILTLTIFTAMLSLVHYLGLESILYMGIGLPLPVYLGALAFLIAIRTVMFLYRTVPVIRRMYLSLSRIVEREETRSVVLVKAPANSQTLGVRKFSTSARHLSKDLSNSSSSVLSLKKESKSPPKHIYKTTLLRLRFSLKEIQELFTVKGGRPLVNIFKGICLLAGTSLTSGSIRYICHFIVTCRGIIRSQGIRGLTIYLKACGTSLQQSLGGHRVYNSTAIAGCRFSRTRTGIPRWIPFHIRNRIRHGDPTAIRVTLTLINVYRIFEFPGKLKLQTITKGFAGTDSLNSYLISVIPRFMALFVWSRFSPSFIKSNLIKWAKDAVFPIFKGGPGVKGIFGEWNSRPDITMRALVSLMRNPVLWESFTALTGLLEYPKINWAIRVIEHVKDIKFKPLNEEGKPNLIIKPLPFLGKLGTKEEAAGKIRVFAMVDAWTQWALYPYHKALFLILRDVQMDGTFDQTAPLAKVKAVRGLYSLDLSAATDRLPIRIQKELLGYLFGYEFASAWANLLVGRIYRLHVNKTAYLDLRYEVGQPMGALSSWASLAFTHHFVVQAAAWRAGFPKWKLYTNYAVLGDDVVIGDSRVVTQYLLILQSLGVECGLHKSLLSHKGTALEFAKRTIVNGIDCSPISFKEYWAASRSLGAFVELFRKTGITFAVALQAFGTGWKVRSWLNKPIGKLSARIRLLILAVNIPQTPEMVTEFFELGRVPVAQFKNETEAIMAKFVSTEFTRLKSRLLLYANKVKDFDSSEWGRDWAREVVSFAHRMSVEEFLAWAKIDKIFKSNVLPSVKLLRDAFSNIANLTWHPAKVDGIAQTQKLVTEIQNVKTENFAQLYIEYLRLNQEISSMSLHAFAKVRPQIAEIPGLLNPIQIRLWKRWSAMIQGSQDIS